MYSKFISAIECSKKTVKLGFLHYWHDRYVHTGFLVLKTWVACLFSKANRIYHLLWIDNCMVLTSMLSHPAATPFVEGSRGNLTVLWFSHNMPFVRAESLAVRCFSFERTIILCSHLKKKVCPHMLCRASRVIEVVGFMWYTTFYHMCWITLWILFIKRWCALVDFSHLNSYLWYKYLCYEYECKWLSTN